MLSCCESESTLNLIILSYLAVYNHDTSMHVNSASISNAVMSLVKLIKKNSIYYDRISVKVVLLHCRPLSRGSGH